MVTFVQNDERLHKADKPKREAKEGKGAEGQPDKQRCGCDGQSGQVHEEFGLVWFGLAWGFGL